MFGREFVSWQVGTPPAHARCSPNLRALRNDLLVRYPGLTNLGCYGVRPVRGGGAISSHSYGAAIDIGFDPSMLTQVWDEVIPFLVSRSHELHLQAIHDYRAARIWRAARTPLEQDACDAWWRAQRHSGSTGMGQEWCNHLHLETTPTGWGDDSAIAGRFNP